jgi:hypothetical protein
VEFLDDQMDRTEVLAIEVRQYVGAGQTALVPVVVGRPQRPDRRPSPPARQWDATSFLDALQERGDGVDAGLVEALLAWAGDHGVELRWGRGAKHGSVNFSVSGAQGRCEPITLWDSGKSVQVSINVARLRQGTPFAEPGRCETLFDRLNAVPGLVLPPDAVRRQYPAFRLATLAPPAGRDAFLRVLEWLVADLRDAATAEHPDLEPVLSDGIPR